MAAVGIVRLMGGDLSRRDRFYTGVIVVCAVMYLIIGFSMLSVYMRAGAPTLPVPVVPTPTWVYPE